MNLTISAIITTFNRAGVVSRAIDSILAQTRPPDEIIVVDDGSSDNTQEVVERYGPAVRYVRQRNRGLSGARNTGVRESRCDWVAFLDDDDEWFPAKLERQVAGLQAAPEAVLCYTAVSRVRPSGEVEILMPNPPDKIWPAIRLKTPFTPCSLMVRKDVFQAAGGFDEKLRCVEDWEFFIRLTPQRRMVGVLEPLVRVYGDSGMSMRGETMLQTELSIVDSLLVGLSGLRRFTWKLRILSRMYYRAGISARAHNERGLRHLLRSLIYWPSPLFEPARYKTIAISLLGLRR